VGLRFEDKTRRARSSAVLSTLTKMVPNHPDPTVCIVTVGSRATGMRVFSVAPPRLNSARREGR
jgi:hypothetical protein